jgi:hypothetical protein
MVDRRNLLAGMISTAALVGCAGRAERREPRIRPARRPDIDGQSYDADLIVYGATPTAIASAVVAAREGASVILVGGWREKHLGGMMGGGLGWTDIGDIEACGGFAKEALQTIAGGGVEGNPFAFNPARARQYFQDLLRLAGVPFVQTTGVLEVVKVDRGIRRFSTRCGKTFSGRVFIDGSYEGDLAARAGVSMKVGREAQSERNSLSGFMAAHKEVTDVSKALLWRKALVSPFVVDGDPGSGLLPSVRPHDFMAKGSADKGVPAYNFRMIMTTRPDLRIDLPATPPDGYDARAYEPHIRYLQSIEKLGWRYGVEWSLNDDLIKGDDLGGGLLDVNNQGYFSTDYPGGNWDYPEADYDTRERIWRDHQAYTRGLFYTWAWSPDRRIPEALRRETRQWGLARGVFDDPFPGDAAGWPYQLYVREARRLDNGLEWSGADLAAPDELLRKNSTIALASYMQDSHAVQRLAVQDNRGSYMINEGGLGVQSGGVDGVSPLPYELIVPHEDECTNLYSTFCVAASHQAFSSIRMEPPSMAIGEAAGLAATLILNSRETLAVQKVDYPSLKRLILLNGGVLKKR